MKKMLFALGCLLSAAVLAESPVSSVVVSQDAATDEIVVTYDLSCDAVITMSVAVGGESLPENLVTQLKGAVNRKVAAGTGREIRWNVAREFRPLAAGETAVTLTSWPLDNPPDYMVADLRIGKTVNYYTSTNALPGGLANPRYRTSALLMRKIPAKNIVWTMGSPEDEKTQSGGVVHTAAEKQVRVKLTDNYYIGVYELTQHQSKLFGVSSAASCTFSPISNQVVQAGWLSTAEFPAACTYVNIRGTPSAVVCEPASGSAILTLRELTGVSFDLPTEAQWEFACRAGKGTMNYSGISIFNANVCTNLNRYAWYYYEPNSNNSTAKSLKCPQPVGLKLSNAWGLYDMLGNMTEWTRDCYADEPQKGKTEPVENPIGDQGVNKDKCTVRGGSWSSNARDCRAAWRTSYTCSGNKNYTGVRFVCPCEAK